jgi:polar amino acid transport system substrate-binding protein
MKFIFFICSYLLCITVQANSVAVPRVKLITVAAPEIRPFIYKNEQGENEGLLIDTIKKLNDSGKFNISVEVMPWARALKAVENGHFDALMPTVRTADRDLFLSFPTQPLINFYGSKIYKRVEDKFIYQSIPLIDNTKKIVKVRSTYISREGERAFKDASITFIEATRLEDAFNMLIHGRVDLLVADSVIANTTVEKMEISALVKGFSLSDKYHSSFLAFSKEYSSTHNINELMNEINLINDPDSYNIRSEK